jgi:hypothetical protein
MSDEVQTLHHAAHFLPQIFGPFVNIINVFLNGVRLHHQLERPANPPLR